MTTSFFKQEFREKVPETIYFLGNSRLEAVFSDHRMPGTPEDVRYKIKGLPVKGSRKIS